MKPKEFTEEKGGVVHVHFEPEGTYIRQDDVYRLMKEYADQQLILSSVVKSLPTQKEIDLKAEERAIKHNYINEIGFIRHKTSFQLGALFIKKHLEKQK